MAETQRTADRTLTGSDRPAFPRRVGDLPAGSFALVMATGIVSIAADLSGHNRIAAILLAFNLIAFLVLSVWALLLLLQRPTAILSDLRHDQRGPGLLTIVAGTSVLGDQIWLLTSHQSIASGLWIGALVIWACLIYSLFAVATIRPEKPPLGEGLDGSWLLAVVAPESLAILGSEVNSLFSAPETIVFASLCLFLLGGLFYLIIITLILYRWLFERMRPEQLTLSYWINMGAAAITTVAAVQLQAAVRPYPSLVGSTGFLVGETMLFWSTASWWIPLVTAVMIWRHVIGGVRLTYRFEYWSMVFPLGMYAVATFSVTRLVGIGGLSLIARVFFWIAMAAWCLIFFGMMRHLIHILRISLGAAPARENAE